MLGDRQRQHSPGANETHRGVVENAECAGAGGDLHHSPLLVAEVHADNVDAVASDTSVDLLLRTLV